MSMRQLQKILSLVAVICFAIAFIVQQVTSVPPTQATIATSSPVIATTSVKTQLPPAQNSTSSVTYSVYKIVDGDTVDVLINGVKMRIRVIGIDTPEVVKSGEKPECFGKEASDRAYELLEGKEVMLEFDKVAGDTDKYDRYLRHIFVDQKNYAEEMIKGGFGKQYAYRNQKYAHRPEFEAAEKFAKDAQMGLWGPNACQGM